MALIKTLPTNLGVNATYWRITRMESNFDGKTAVTLSGYVDAAARKAGAIPLASLNFDCDLQDVGRSDVYVLITAPRPVTRVITQPVEAVPEISETVDGVTTILVPAVEAVDEVTETVESNDFADAESA